MAKKTSGGIVRDTDLPNDIRAAIRATRKSANEIAKGTRIPQATITRFLAGADMKLSTASKLAAHLGLKLEPGYLRPVSNVPVTNKRAGSGPVNVRVAYVKNKRK